jgi:hypothetical protein
MIEITEEIAAKVLTIVDAGLTSGLGKPKPGEMCIEAAVCYVLGQPHSDKPACVSKALRAFKIRLNDSDWSNRHARAIGLRRLALAQLGSAGYLDEVLFVTRLAILAKKWAYDGGCAARGAATRCARAAATYAARAAADAAIYAASAADDAATYAAYYADAARGARATGDAAYYADAARGARATGDAASATGDAARAAAYAADAAADATRAATDAATYAASAADDAARATADATRAAADAAHAVRNEALANAAEDVVQLLVEMNAPGTKWLALAPLIKGL